MFAPDALYTFAHFAIKGYGKVAPAPKIVVGCCENHPANTPTAIRTTATAMTATTIRMRLPPPDRRLSSSVSSEGVAIFVHSFFPTSNLVFLEVDGNPVHL